MPPPHSYQWSTPVGLVSCGWLLALVAATWAGFGGSPMDQVFAILLAVVLAAVSACGSILRPRLSANSAGLAVRRLRGTQQWPWSQVQVGVRKHRRLGRTVSALELDVPDDEATPGGLIILSRLDLGADPADVADILEELQVPPG